MSRYALLLPILALAACGGVDDEDLLVDLDDDDWEAVCADLPEETFTCEMGEGVTSETSFGGDSCRPETNDGVALTITETCVATAGDLRACDEAFREVLRADPCSSELPSECAWFNGCFAMPE